VLFNIVFMSFFPRKRNSCAVLRSKKAFTLVELSVVLLVLAFLVGGILISKKIVDRSKGQSIINDLEQMKKAVNLFYDSYGYLPGDMPQPELQKYPEFLSKYLNQCPYGGSLCDTSSAYAQRYSIGNGFIELFESCYASRMLETLGFIYNVPNATQGGLNVCDYSDFGGSSAISVNTKKAKSSQDIAIFLASGLNTQSVTSAASSAGNIIGNSLNTGVANISSSLFHELTVTDGKLSANNPIYNTNFISLFSIVDGYKLAAVTSTVASYVDKKYDDGLPYSGDLVSGMVPTRLANITAVDQNAMCSTLANSCITAGNCTTASLSSAQYQTKAPNSLAQGCNMYLRISVIK
jgi:prepilin-type N-terminal cleavage/methylation domain-containing protein